MKAKAASPALSGQPEAGPKLPRGFEAAMRAVEVVRHGTAEFVRQVLALDFALRVASPSYRAKAEKKCAEAALLAANQKYDEAADVFVDAILYYPDEPRFYFALGGVLENGGRLHDAIEMYKEAFSLGEAIAIQKAQGLTLAGTPNIVDGDHSLPSHESNNQIDTHYLSGVKGGMELTNLENRIEAILKSNGVGSASVRATIREALSSLLSSEPRKSHDQHLLSVPQRAPKLYADRPKGQNIIDFLHDPEGWGPYIKAGVLTRPDLRRLDRNAYMALSYLEKTSEDTVPPDLRLASKREILDRELGDAEKVRAAQRLLRARARRHRHAKLG